jgi:ankyrin repeat protein
VQALKKAGADVNIVDNQGKTPIFWASRNGHLEVVQALIAAGADVNIVDKQGMRAIFWPANNGHLEVVQVLKEALKKQKIEENLKKTE